ncbi:hypothetical protein HP397_03625 [Streptobacillus felis]|uniref:Uncharacterized protein n=1 Tax=Streptobacillus felis TaxID=1384509 RepID=A0A7Z0PEQ1_9FUSO|nr:hypothetical protein [Streptobacillus felis]NYV27909.1 hypothetical protein [Streptobacillus felis]
MKKNILLMTMLPLATFASDKVFDFKNAKPFGGEVETNLTVSNEISKEENNKVENTNVKHDLGLKVEIYDFVTLGAKVGYGYKGQAKETYFDAANSELSAKADFKKYGNIKLTYEMGGEYGPSVELKYANEGKIKPVTVGGHAAYKYTFVPNVKLANSELVAQDINAFDGEVYVSHDVNKDISLTGKSGINVSVGTQKLFNSDEIKKTVIETDIRLGAKVDYTVNPIVKLTTDNEIGIVINHIKVPLVEYKPITSVRFKSDNKVEIKAVKGLLVTPAFSVDTKKYDTKLNTSVRADYEILKGLSVNGTLGFENDFKYNSDGDKQEYYSTTPYAKLGLAYKW